MAFIKFLKNSFLDAKGDQHPEASPVFIQKRQQRRFDVNSPELCTVEIPAFGKGLVPLVNISHFGGFAKLGNLVDLEQIAMPAPATLSISGRRHALEISKIDKRRDGFGMAFRHKTPEAMQAMCELLMPFQWGASAAFLGEEASHVGVERVRRLKFRGEAAFDLTVECAKGDEIIFLMCNFMLLGGEYVSVVWDKGTVLTKRSLKPGDRGARMAQTPTPDQFLIALGATGCLGMNFPIAASCAVLLTQFTRRNS